MGLAPAGRLTCGSSNLVARTIAEHADRGKIIVEKSTIPVKTADTITSILASNTRGLKFQVLSNPEFLAEARR